MDTFPFGLWLLLDRLVFGCLSVCGGVQTPRYSEPCQTHGRMQTGDEHLCTIIQKQEAVIHELETVTTSL